MGGEGGGEGVSRGGARSAGGGGGGTHIVQHGEHQVGVKEARHLGGEDVKLAPRLRGRSGVAVRRHCSALVRGRKGSWEGRWAA